MGGGPNGGRPSFTSSYIGGGTYRGGDDTSCSSENEKDTHHPVPVNHGTVHDDRETSSSSSDGEGYGGYRIKKKESHTTKSTTGHLVFSGQTTTL